jgi:hypothetical protein
MSGEVRRLAMWPEKGLGNEEEGCEEKVTQEGVTEKKISWRKPGVSNGESLEPAGEGFGI